jgi:AcrR family transcriptional regulator
MNSANAAPKAIAGGSQPRESRSHRRQRIEAELIAHSMKLFCEQGFDNTTVVDIANEVGISRRTFFRYFSAKEDLVFFWLDEQGDYISAVLRSRPKGETAANSMAYAYLSLVQMLDRDNGEMLEQTRLIFAEPQLTRRYHEENIKWENRFAGIIVERDRATPGDFFTTNLQVSSMTTAFVLAIRYWSATDKASSLMPWVTRAFTTVNPDFSPSLHSEG